MPWYSNNNSNSDSERSFSNNRYTPEWDPEKAERNISEELARELAKPGLTRKQLNNALKAVLPKNKPQVIISFFQHVIKGNYRDVKQFIDQGVDLYQKAKDGTTCVHYAIYAPDPLPMLKLLLDAGADVNAFNNRSHSPLHVALLRLDTRCTLKDYETIHYLLDRGAILYPVRWYVSVLTTVVNLHKALDDKIRSESVSVFTYSEHPLYNDLFRCIDLEDRMWDMDEKYVRLLKFKTLASNDIIAFEIDTRATMRILRDYAKYWILKSETVPDLILPGKKTPIQSDEDLNKTIAETGLNEDTVITLIPKLKSGFHSAGGSRRKTQRRRRRD